MINSKESKIWGETRCLFSDNNVEVHRIKANKFGYCSIHKHSNKYNIFFVETGKLKVTIFRDDAGQKIEDITILGPEEMTVVGPGLLHQFEALEDTVALEIYYVKLNENDIIRESLGGIKKSPENKSLPRSDYRYMRKAANSVISNSPIYCGHANECPMNCTCDRECYCYVYGNCGMRRS